MVVVYAWNVLRHGGVVYGDGIPVCVVSMRFTGHNFNDDGVRVIISLVVRVCVCVCVCVCVRERESCNFFGLRGLGSPLRFAGFRGNGFPVTAPTA